MVMVSHTPNSDDMLVYVRTKWTATLVMESGMLIKQNGKIPKAKIRAALSSNWLRRRPAGLVTTG